METLDLKHIDKNYGFQLRDVAYQIVKDYDLAKDIMQESFINIWRNQDKFDKSKGALFTWMRKIVVRKSIDAMRSKHFKTSREEMPKYTSLSNGYDKIDVGNMDVKTYLDSIEFKYAFVIEKIYLEGFSSDQITERYKIPLGTVKGRKKIGLRKLNEVWKHTR